MDKHADGVGFQTLVAFFLLAFGLSWGVLGLYLLVPAFAEFVGPMGNSHPLFILAVYAPTITAFALVLYHGGFEGLQRFSRGSSYGA